MTGDGGIDKWRHLKYVSTRLASYYLQLLEAGAEDESGPRHFRAPLNGYGGFSKPPEPIYPNLATQNPIQAAKLLDSGLAETYLDLSHADQSRSIASGRIVKASLLMQPAHLQIQNYELVHPSVEPYYTVSFTSLDRIEGVGRVFIGLIGSERNLLELPGDGRIGARSASDARGLYEMIQYTKETIDVDIDKWNLDHEFPARYQDATERQRICLAAEAFDGFGIRVAPRPMEVLFEAHHVARDIDLEELGLRHFGEGKLALAIVGAPIWVREATDRTLLSVEDILVGPEKVDELWRLLDEELRKSIDDVFYRSSWAPSTADDWQHFGEWAAAWSKRVGSDPVRLSYFARKYRFFGQEFGPHTFNVTDSGIIGWRTNESGIGYLISEAGEIYHVGISEGETVNVGGEGAGPPQRMMWSDLSADDAASAILVRITSWIVPFS